MIATASILFALKRAGYFLLDHWKIVLGVIAALIVVAVLFKACRTEPKLNHEQIIRNQEAAASGERKRMEEALVESKVAEAQIDANRANAERQKLATIEAARKEARQMSNEELATELEGLK